MCVYMFKIIKLKAYKYLFHKEILDLEKKPTTGLRRDSWTFWTRYYPSAHMYLYFFHFIKKDLEVSRV